MKSSCFDGLKGSYLLMYVLPATISQVHLCSGLNFKVFFMNCLPKSESGISAGIFIIYCWYWSYIFYMSNYQFENYLFKAKNGGCPVSISKNKTPTAQTSTLLVYLTIPVLLGSKSSGALLNGEPTP